HLLSITTHYVITINSLSLHDALPIFQSVHGDRCHHGGIHAAAQSDQHLLKATLLHVVVRSRDQRAVSISNFFMRLCVDLPLSRRSEEHTSELQSRSDIVCRLLLEKKK